MSEIRQFRLSSAGTWTYERCNAVQQNDQPDRTRCREHADIPDQTPTREEKLDVVPK